jgi:hypothetical protein
LHKPWNVPIHIPRVRNGVIAERRTSISFAALFVNVTARIDSGDACPVASSHAMRVVRTRVFAAAGAREDQRRLLRQA